jgi:hypothetical protein
MSELFDGGVFAGRHVETGCEHPVEAVLGEMDRLGIARALIGSYRAVYLDVREGAREAARWAAASGGRLVPLGILQPARYGETPAELLGWMHDELGIRAVGLFSSPSYYAVAWDTPAVRAIGEAAAALGLVLQAGITDEAELAGVLRAWGELRTPIQIRWMKGHRYKSIASEVAAAARHPQLRFDVGNSTSTGSVELLVERIGADRLFVASNAPHAVIDCAQALLGAAQLDESARAAIAAGTLRRDLRLEPCSAVPAGGAASWQALCAEPKIDIHWHHDSWNLGEPCLSPDAQRATWDRFAFERVVVYSIRALNYDLRQGNREALAWTARDARVFAMIVVSPRELEESLAEIERYARHPRVLGLKTIQDLFGLGLDAPEYRPLLERAEARGLPVVAHLPGMDGAARAHPALRFVATHGNWGRTRRLRELPNVSFDFSTGHALQEETQLARFVSEIGVDRVLFGSDGQLVSPAWSLAKLEHACLPAGDRRKILRENALRLFPKLEGS